VPAVPPVVEEESFFEDVVGVDDIVATPVPPMAIEGATAIRYVPYHFKGSTDISNKGSERFDTVLTEDGGSVAGELVDNSPPLGVSGWVGGLAFSPYFRRSVRGRPVLDENRRDISGLIRIAKQLGILGSRAVATERQRV
jgi:hypothetical protein